MLFSDVFWAAAVHVPSMLILGSEGVKTNFAAGASTDGKDRSPRTEDK